MGVWGAVADSYDPPTPDHPHGWASPADFAEATGRGRWRRWRHIDIMEKALLEAIETGGRVMLSVSVRHGKSILASQALPAWYLGRNPENRVILAGHEADFTAQHSGKARALLSEHGPAIFGVSVSKRSSAADRWDIEGHDGGMLAIGVGGSPIGRGADLLIVDDPVKTWQAAMSPTVRKTMHEWWTGTMISRIEPGAAVVIICARWHEDDLTGFLLREDGANWHEVRMPALCDDPASDPLGRAMGEPMWPERWPVDELERRHHEVSLSLGEQVWLAQYQQRPRRPEGGVFPPDKWVFLSTDELEPLRRARSCRGWDLAATSDGGDFTVGARVTELADGRWLVDEVVRGQWSSDVVRVELEGAAGRDGKATLVELPQDPGQAGKAQVAQLTRLLAGHDVEARVQTGTKEVRAAGFSAQQRAGNVILPRDASWVPAFVSECEDFPKGRHDDQVDAVASAFNRLAGSRPRRAPQGHGSAGRRLPGVDARHRRLNR